MREQAVQIVPPVHHDIQLIIRVIPDHAHHAADTGGDPDAVLLRQAGPAGVEAPDASVSLQFRARIDAGPAGRAVGRGGDILTGVGRGAEGYVHIPAPVEGDRLGNVPVSAVFVIVGKDEFRFSGRHQFPCRQFIAVKGQGGAEIKVALVDGHGRTVETPLVIHSAEPHHHVGPPVEIAVAQGDVAAVDGIGGTELDV